MIDPQIQALAVDIGELYPDPANLNKHGETSINSKMASLRRFGQVRPVLALSDGRVIAGCGLFEAARRLGWQQIACIRSDKLSSNPTEATAYGIADNRLARLSEMDEIELGRVLEALSEQDAADGLGYDGDDIAALIAVAQVEEASSLEESGGGDDDEEEPESKRPDDTEGKSHKFALVFTNEEERAEWMRFLGRLKKAYALDTHTERLLAFARDHEECEASSGPEF